MPASSSTPSFGDTRSPSSLSKAERFALLPKVVRDQILSELTEDELVRLAHDWKFYARPPQLPPTDPWDVWLVDAGRGFGKTRTGAELVHEWAKDFPHIALVGRTASDVRDVMISGESGIMATAKPWFRPTYYPGRRQVVWPNGTVASTFTSAEPDELRGPNFYKAWGDEIAAWKYPDETWDMLQLGMRLGANPQTIATTTPKNIKLIRRLLAMATDLAEIEGKLPEAVMLKRTEARGGRPCPEPLTRVRVSAGSSYDNMKNLAPTFIANIIQQYVGTKREKQEIFAQLVTDDPNALFKRDRLDELRLNSYPTLKRICVAIDPSGSIEAGAAECGIVVAGLGEDDRGYLLGDASSVCTPAEWGRTALDLYKASQANAIVAEKNFGGLMVEHVIRSMVRPGEEQPFIEMVNASRGKHARAEPIAALVEQDPGMIVHIGAFPELEDELCMWVPGEKSPNRLDAYVWAFYWLMVRPGEKRYGVDYGIL